MDLSRERSRSPINKTNYETSHFNRSRAPVDFRWFSSEEDFDDGSSGDDFGSSSVDDFW